MSKLRRSLTFVTISGSLCMVFIAAVNSPVFIAFVRSLGATEMHIGLLGGLPMVMLIGQFVGAILANRVARRKPAFLVLVILGRMIYLPIALLPLFMGASEHLVDLIVVLVALSSALGNIVGPAWFSWMADIIPRPIVNRYWASRYRTLQLTWLVSTLAVAAFVYYSALDVKLAFLVLAVIGVLAGVLDILLFIWVDEPPNQVIKGQPLFAILTAPLREPVYRSFVIFQCVWTFTAMFGASFMQLYAMENMHLGTWKTTVVWSFTITNALMAPYWGRLADRHGHRSIIAMCVSMKPLVILLFLLVTPSLAFVLLAIGFFVDSIWNAGIFVASSGYMMKVSPKKNRTMFIAAMTGLSGISGGIGAVCAGMFLKGTADFHLTMLGREWINYHLLFLLDLIMRIGCAFLVYRIREPESTGHDEVLNEVRGAWPMRFLLFPVGFYRQRVLPTLKDTAETVIRNTRNNTDPET